MKKSVLQVLLCLILLLDGAAGVCATFDERLWEKYAQIELPNEGSNGSLAALPLDSYRLGDLTASTPFADFRVVTDRKEEVPWQIISKRPESRQEVIAFQMRNLSTTENGDTWAEFLVDENGTAVNTLQIISPDTNYIRPVEVLGSRDGKAWQTLRKDGVIFELDKGEKLKNDRLSIPKTTFPHLAIRIANGGKEALKITEVRLFRQSRSAGQTYRIRGTIEKQAFDDSRKENSVVVRMDKVFPVDSLEIVTNDRNFQRFVTVEAKNNKGVWRTVASGVLYRFNSPDLQSSQLSIELPEISAGEYRLVFRNHDSPPLTISSVSGIGYRRVLVFKTYPDRKLFLFWGNPSAKNPQYDLAKAINAETVDKLPVAGLGPVRENPSFAGDEARLPFSERYQFLLYGVVILAIAALLFMQYRVFRRIHVDDAKTKS